MPSWIARAYGAFHRHRRRRAALSVKLPPVYAEFNADGVQRVLVVCTGLMGDTLMSLPAMASARGLFPRAEVVGLVTESVRGLLELSGRFDRFIVADGAPLSLHPGRRRENAALEARLTAEAFDVGVIFLGDDYAPMLTRARIPWRVFVDETPYRRLATRSYRIGDARTWGPTERFEAWKALGLEPHPRGITLTPPSTAVDEVDARLRRLHGPIVLLHPFGRTPEQWWPEPAWRALASLIRGKLGGTAILIGANSSKSTGHGSPALEVMGCLPMPTLVALFRQADCVVSTDSGPFHLAGTMGRPGVGLFRASRPEHARRYASVEPIIGPPDAACSARCSWVRCRTSPCVQMAGIPASAVLEMVRRKLKAGGHAEPESDTRTS
jgi:ADP-heptose:LPS heptosyltransferase